MTRNPEKSETHPPEFCAASGDWDELGIPNLAEMVPMKCFWMLQNARVMVFTVSKLLRKNQWGRGIKSSNTLNGQLVIIMTSCLPPLLLWQPLHLQASVPTRPLAKQVHLSQHFLQLQKNWKIEKKDFKGWKFVLT